MVDVQYNGMSLNMYQIVLRFKLNLRLNMNYVLKLHQRFSKLPFGKHIFSHIVARIAPYFLTINPKVEELRPNYIKVSMRKRPAVHNHIKTVHAIAACNLCEFAAGTIMEASIPKHKRWIPMGMQVSYLKKANTDLEAICDLNNPDWDNIDHKDCEVSVLDKNGVEVVKALITMKVSDKKKKI